MMKKFFASLTTMAIALMCAGFSVSADYVTNGTNQNGYNTSYNTSTNQNYTNATYKSPYVSSWEDALKNVTNIDYYEYSSNDNGYIKTSRVQVCGTAAYLYTSKYRISDALMSTDDVGFDISGNVIFVEQNGNVFGIKKNDNNTMQIGNDSTGLVFDRVGFVVGYYSRNGGTVDLSTSNYNWSGTNSSVNGQTNWNGNQNQNWNNNQNWNGNQNQNWNNNQNNNNQNWNGNQNQNWNNNQNNNNQKYPYITRNEDGYLTYVESSCEQHVLYYEDGHLCFNNIILYKKSLKEYAFGNGCVWYVTGENKLIKYTFGQKKQTVVASKVDHLVIDNYGFATGYVTTAGKSISF